MASVLVNAGEILQQNPNLISGKFYLVGDKDLPVGYFQEKISKYYGMVFLRN